MSKTILIAGGTGLIGTFLKKHLQSDGYKVRILSRNSALSNDHTFHWDPQDNSFDSKALQGVDVLINLVGASIASHRWSTKRREILRSSRVDTTQFLLKKCLDLGVDLSTYIGGSAVGIYGNRKDHTLTEKSEPGSSDFLVELCKDWEEAHSEFEQVANRVANLRTGILLSNQGGAWPLMKRSVILGIGAYFGSGQQYMPWIHIEDHIGIVHEIIQNETINGVVNAVAPNPVTNRQFVQSIIHNRGGLNLLLPIPAPLLRVVLGKMSSILLDSQRVLPEKMTKLDFPFIHRHIDTAIADLIEHREH